MTDTEKAALERRIDELCSGNQRLIEEVMSLEAALEGMHIINDRYRADYAKLQKVCKEMHDHIKDSCDVCDEYYCSSWDEDMVTRSGWS